MSRGILDYKKLINLTGCSRSTVFRAIKLYKNRESLHDKPKSGRKRKIDNNVSVINMVKRESSIPSPDLNPIEMVWAIMKNKIGDVHGQNLGTWAKKIEKVWEDFPMETIEKLICSMHWRVREVLRLNGLTINNNARQM